MNEKYTTKLNEFYEETIDPFVAYKKQMSHVYDRDKINDGKLNADPFLNDHDYKQAKAESDLSAKMRK